MAGLIGKLKRAIVGKPAPKWRSHRRRDEHLTERRYEAAETTRLNATHWAHATDDPINCWLAHELPTLRARSMWEYKNNPTIRGMVETHVTDLVGRRGPRLSVISNTPGFNDRLETEWRQWWDGMPDGRGKLPGPEILKQWIRQLWVSGEFLSQIVSSRDSSARVDARLVNIHARRLETPLTRFSAERMVLGIDHDDMWRPTQYWFRKPQLGTFASSLEFDSVPAANVLHGFVAEEPDQVRGVPWLAPALPVAADIRDYDAEVLDAARMAADWSTSIASDHPDIEPVGFADGEPDPIEIERHTMRFLPPGWKPHSHVPPQPSTQYVDYRKERHRDLGRAVSMPGLIVRLDASDHNFSSAKLDDRNYHRRNQEIAGWLERVALNRLVQIVVREAIGDGIPDEFNLTWTWPVRPVIDDQKEAGGAKIRLESRTSNPVDEVEARGVDFDEHVAKWGRAQQAFSEAEVELEKVPAATVPPREEEDDDDA